MARIAPPLGYSSWNVYIEKMANDGPDQSIEARRLIKRDIKLGIIARQERFAEGDITSPSYRPYHIYEKPGTFSPTIGHPWLTEATDHLAELLLENGIDWLGTEDNNQIIAE